MLKKNDVCNTKQQLGNKTILKSVFKLLLSILGIRYQTDYLDL